jgi:hypothetical protein
MNAERREKGFLDFLFLKINSIFVVKINFWKKSVKTNLNQKQK